MGDHRLSIFSLFVITLLLLSFWSSEVIGLIINGRGKEDDEIKMEVEGDIKQLFMLGKFRKVVKTAGGEVRMVTGYRWKGDPNPMHVGFITMEPNTLFIPQYIDANIILFIRTGEVMARWIQKDERIERRLKRGDISVIPTGSAFYLVNTGNAERLQILCSIDSSESLGYGSYESFFIGGGTYPTSVLSGFDATTLSSALNVTLEDVAEIMSRQTEGPIIRLANESVTKLRHFQASMKQATQESEDDEATSVPWSWRKLLGSLVHNVGCSLDDRALCSPHPYNIYDHKPSFKNDHGYTIAVNEHVYHPLEHSDIGVYLVHLKAGSMLAPHMNPTATEYGVVLQGSGSIQVVFPNGSMAMNSQLKEGDAFWIPRYFPFCQVASANSSLEFFGFTTSARRNRPQFLVGRSSLLRRMRGPELAAAFGVSDERLRRIVDAQEESVILPAAQPQQQPDKLIVNVAAA